jgi:hypothetical protein
MRPKFEWLLNIASFFLVIAFGVLVRFLCQFISAQIIMSIIFYGGGGCIAIKVMRHERQDKPRRRFTRSDFYFWRFAGLGAGILVVTLTVLLVGTSLFY